METICNKCGLFISRRKAIKALLLHQWRHHREDIPSRLRTFDQFEFWSKTEDGRKWIEQQLADRIIEVSSEEAGLLGKLSDDLLYKSGSLL